MSKANGKTQHFDLLVKVLMLGNSNVGKTWLLIRYSQEIEPSSSIATIGIDFKWIAQIHRHADTDVNIVLVGNKCDVGADEREVSEEEGQRLADHFAVPFFEASAKKNVNVEAVFTRLAAEVKHRLAREAVESPTKKKGAGAASFKATAADSVAGGSRSGGCC
eukprot:gene6533-4707_t